jgi:hypothetical protein
MIKLPDITIVCVDCINYNQAKNALLKSIQHIEFGGIEFFSDIHIDGISTTIIDKINSKESYSEFIFKKLNNYIQTDFVLVIQFDGYVINPNSWNNEFLNYDYIGAKWWYNDNMNVGNGGFSLRSKRLLQELSNSEYDQIHPEDHAICRLYGETLVDKGFKFATNEIADKFSFEYNAGNLDFKNNTFGFHGIPNLVLNQGVF